MISLKDWQNLLIYYITCLEKEAVSESTFKKENEGIVFETNFLKEETLFSKGLKEIVFPLSERLSRFLEKTFSDSPSKKLYYAYPFVIYSDGLIVPSFISEVAFNIDKKNNTVTLSRINSFPEFSYSLLYKESMLREQIYIKLREIDSRQREDNPKITKNDRFIELLKYAFDQTRFENDNSVDTDSLVHIDLNNSNTEGIVNQALLYWGEASTFTKDLIQELNELTKPIYYEQLENTSLRYLFEKETKKKEKNSDFIFSAIPLDTSQKMAIKKGLTENFTLVAGPPGTGKSQVLVNLVINALIKDKSVLFASKNGKAVDVVYERLNKLTDESYVLRTGNKLIRKGAFEKLTKKAEKIKYGNNKNEFLKQKKKAIESIETINKLNAKIVTRKQLKRKIFMLKKKITKQENNYNWFRKNHGLKTINKEKLILLKKKYERLSLNKRTILELLSDLLSTQKTKDKFIDNFQQILKENGYDFLEVKYFNRIGIILHELEAFEEYKKNLRELKVLNRKLEKIPLLRVLRRKIAECNIFLDNISLSLFQNKWLFNLESASLQQAAALKRFINVEKNLNFFPYSEQTAISLIREVIKILPIWGVTNLSTKDSIPLDGGLFDLVVIDEASQCDIPSSIPLLFRAKRMMIIGDKWQLRHISTIPERKDRIYFNDSKVNFDWNTFSYTKSSLFDLAENRYDTMHTNKEERPLMLTGHYRSHPEIIGFSNNKFYQGELKMLTDTSKFIIENPGMYWVNLKGNGKRAGAGNIYNLIEALKVAEITTSIIKKYGASLSYGVISPYVRQAQIIKEKINNILNNKMDDTSKNIDLLVGVAHIFQGDEKDIIVFSTTISEGMPAGTVDFANGGEGGNLLNVAVTRARQKLIVIGDLEFARKGNSHLKDLADYIIGLGHVIDESEI